jgi:hypothetical protein
VIATLVIAAVVAGAAAIFGRISSQAPSPTPTAVASTPAGPTGSGGSIGGPSGEPGLSPSATAPTSSPTASPVSMEPGLGWVALSTTGLEDAQPTSVVHTADGWLAVGSSTDTGAPPVWASTDGSVWTRAPADASFPAGAAFAVVVVTGAGGPGFVAGGTVPAKTSDGQRDTTRAAIFTSADGLAWTAVKGLAPSNDSEVRALLVTAKGYLAVGRNGGLGSAGWYSAEGTAWKASTKTLRSEPLTAMNGLSAGGPGFVAVGRGPLGAAVWTSKDGVRWRREPDAMAMHRGAMRAVARTTDGLVAVGDSIWTSKNGISWKSVVGVSPQTPELRGLARMADLYIAVGGVPGGGSVALISTDGTAWTRRSDQDRLATADLTAVASDETLVMAVGTVEAPGTGGAVRISTP